MNFSVGLIPSGGPEGECAAVLSPGCWRLLTACGLPWFIDAVLCPLLSSSHGLVTVTPVAGFSAYPGTV